MAERWQDEAWAKDMWWSGKTTRRRFLGLSATAAGALGASHARAGARGGRRSARPSRIKLGALQPLSGTAAAGGKTALVGVADGGRPHQQERRRQRPADRADRRRLRVQAGRRPSQGREARRSRTRSTSHAGGYLSNVCLACMPVYEEHKIVNMISVCLDTTITQSQVQPLHLPALRLRPGPGGGGRAVHGQQDGQEVAHRLRRLRVGPVHQGRLRRPRSRRTAARWSARTGIPLGTADMTPFLSKISGQLRRHLRHLLRARRASPS